MPVAASTQQAVGIVIGLAVVVGWALYLLANVRRVKPEVGSEVELAANRKSYLNDDQLEGPRLERFLGWGLVGLTVCAVGLPLYWLAEPGRQDGAVADFEERLGGEYAIHGQPIGGGALFAPTADGGFNCAGCHGGMDALGAEVEYTLTDPVTGDLRQVEWQAPALNDITLRMSDDQIRQVLVYGRPFSPMPAWGLEGGGPLNEQQIDNLILYLHRIAVTPEDAQEQRTEEAKAELDRLKAEAEKEPTEAGGEEPTMGMALFNLNCARCHTLGWSYDEPQVAGGGAFGPSLYNSVNQFPAVEDHVEFVADGVEEGEAYGLNGQATGRMPYFGQVLSPEQIQAIVDYERSLAERVNREAAGGDQPATPPPNVTTTTAPSAGA